MYEARRILEVSAAALAAERATEDELATISREVDGMFASLGDGDVFLVHDVNFHRSVAAASGNPIVASLVEMVSALYYERRVQTAARAAESDRRAAAEAHRRIYEAITRHDVEGARLHMNAHLIEASAHQARELGDEPDLPLHKPSTMPPSHRQSSGSRSRRTATRRQPPSDL